MAFDLTITIAALFTLMSWTYLIKDNVIYRFAANTVIGMGAGILVTTNLGLLQSSVLNPLQAGDLLPIIGVILGLLFFTRPFGYDWIARFPIALVMGVGTASFIGGFAQTQVIKQIQSTVGLSFTLDNTIVIIFCLASLIYFIFTFKLLQRGALKHVSTLGRYGMMITFGGAYAMFGTGRITVLIERLQFLILTWLYPMLGLTS